MSLNLNGDMGKNMFYSVNMYQDFDPGTFKPKSVIRISLCRTAKRNPLIFPI